MAYANGCQCANGKGRAFLPALITFTVIAFSGCTATSLYHTDEELDAIIYDDILAEAERVVDSRHLFIEANVSAIDDPDRSG